MSERLAMLKAAIDEIATLEQVDAMLAELPTLGLDDEETAYRIQDGLLDMRFLMATLASSEAGQSTVA